MANLFPLFLKLEGRDCLVVGGGSIAAQKLDGLLSAGAHLHVVAPKADDRIRELVSDGRLRWSQREFRPSDVTGAVLVVAATGDPMVNETVFREAQSRGVLCNAVDEPDHCNFYYPAVVRRGDLQIAISTAGHSPALAQRLRKDLTTLLTTSPLGAALLGLHAGDEAEVPTPQGSRFVTVMAVR